jgi:ribosome-interacting GTPase 1
MKPTLILANKADLNGAGDTFALFQEYLSLPLPCFSVSALAKTGLEELKAAIYKALGILRVYTKAPGKEADLTSPYVVKERTTVYEFAGLIHKEIQQTLKYARIWGRKVFDGQMVQRDYVLNEGDIIELHSTKAG